MKEKSFEPIRKYVLSVCDQTGWDLTTLARRAGLAASTLTRPMNSKDWKGGLSLRSLGKIAKASGVSVPREVSNAIINEDGGRIAPPPNGGPPSIEESAVSYEMDIGGETFVSVPAFDARVSAGPGAESLDYMIHRLLFRAAWVRRYTSAPFRDLAVVEVSNDSMAPTLQSGDSALVDRSQRLPAAQDGIYVLRRDHGLQVKRLRTSFRTRAVDVISDNPAYPPDLSVPIQDLDICGRVLWIGRRI